MLGKFDSYTLLLYNNLTKFLVNDILFYKKIKEKRMLIYKRGICIIMLIVFSFLFCPSLYSEEKKGGLGEWKPFGFLGKLGEWNPLGEGDIKKFINAYAKYSIWNFRAYYYARDYKRERPYYSWTKGNFENRYPSFRFTYNMDYEHFYRRNLRIHDAYFYVNYTPQHKWKGNSYYYMGPYNEESITVNGWVEWLIKRNKSFYIITGWDYSRTRRHQDEDDLRMGEDPTLDWYWDAAADRWIYDAGHTADYQTIPWYYNALGGQTTTNWDMYLGLGYHGKQY